MPCDASSSWLHARNAPAMAAAATATRSPAPPTFHARRRVSRVSCCAGDGAARSSGSSPSVSSRSYNPVSARPLESPAPEITRRWIESDSDHASPERFMVASYNILGDRNAFQHGDLYTNVPRKYLEWSRRKRVICEELIEWNPDIICLQEVDKYSDISGSLAKAGYVGSYKRRSGGYVDGCATFWKADKFRLLEGENIEFKSLGLRDNVAQLSVFEMCKDSSRRLLIGNIHVIYRPSRGDIKLGQIRSLAKKAHMLSKKCGDTPVLLAGDFNSTPQSEIYKFLSSSELNFRKYNRRELSGQQTCHPSQVLDGKQEINFDPISMFDSFPKNSWTEEELRTATGNSDGYEVIHPLDLTSSYATVKGSKKTRESNGEPLATSYHSKFLGTVDYIWYSNGVYPTRVLDTVSIDDLCKTGGLPCSKIGSDHLALVCEFGFTLLANEGDTSAA